MRFPRILPRKVKFFSDTHIECEGRFDRFEVDITVDHQPNYRHKYTASVKYQIGGDWISYSSFEYHGETKIVAITRLIRFMVERKEVDYRMKIESSETITFSVEGSELTDDRYR